MSAVVTADKAMDEVTKAKHASRERERQEM